MLIGRDGELAAIQDALQRGARLVTLVGPGGAGKTTLARAAPGFTFLPLAEARSAADLDELVRRGLELADGASVEGALAARGPCRLLLDNLEQLDDDGLRAIAAWSGAAPELTLLATSRRRLGLRDEQVIAVGALGPADATALFVERVARAGAGGLSLDPAQVARVCDRVDRLPLALELAAGRVPALGLAGVEAHLGDPGVLADPAADREPRHSRLDEVVRWSWVLLPAALQRALAELSLLGGSFSAAEGAWAAPPAVLAALVDASLVRADPSGVTARYQLYEAVQRYASARLAEDPGNARARCLRALLDRARPLADAVDGPDGVAALGELRALVPHLVPFAPDDPVGVALAVEPVLAADGPIVLRRRLLAAAVQAAPGAWEPLALLAQTDPARVPAEALEEALTRVRSAGDVRGELEVRVALGRAWWAQGRLPEAEGVLVEAAALSERAGEPTDQVAALLALGGVQWAQRRAPGVADLYRRALVLAEALSPTILAVLRATLGMLLHDLGDPGAEALLVEAAAGLGGDRRRIGVLAGLADLALERGDPQRATALAAEALGVVRRSGQLRTEAVLLGTMARALEAEGDLDGARTAFATAEATSAVHSHPVVTATLACWRARVLAATGRLDEAEAAIGRGRAGLGPGSALARLCDAHLALARGDLEPVRQALEGAQDEARTAAEVRVAAAQLREALTRAAPVLRVGPEAAWFQAPGGGTVEIGTRLPIRRVLQALVDAHPQPLDVGALFAAGWPGQRAVPDAARDRVYHAVGTLRRMGLEAWIERGEGGWRLDPRLRMDAS